MTDSDARKVNVICLGHIFLTGLFVWLFASSDWIWFGWFGDPTVAKVGKTISVVAGPVWLIAVIRSLMSSNPP